jgi:alpha-L-arabinofuranosidase
MLKHNYLFNLICILTMSTKNCVIKLYRRLWMIISVIVLWSLSVEIIAQNTISSCTIDISRPGAFVAPICRGQQIEEFNHQFEGGLYAQLINNPSFEEIDSSLNKTPTANWFIIKSGSSDGKIYGQTFSETSLLNNNQNHCLKLEVSSVASGIVGVANGGYWGIKLENNKKYKVSFWAKKGTDYKGTIKVKLESNTGKIYAESKDFKPAEKWQHFTCELTPGGVPGITGNNRFVLYANAKGALYFDVVTLMPPAWKDRPNGMRIDLAERLDALKFKYIQFPGGCTAESYKMSECWNWKNSVGPLEQRAGSTRDRWWYNNELYFGLDEYLQLCEDIGAEPLYTTSAGLSEPHLSNGQWYGICPLEKMQPIIDDILDLIQYCNGSISTTWGAKRAANGHPKPYNLKYIEIGNESMFEYNRDGVIYNDRFKMISDAVKSVYPNIKIMYNGDPAGKLSHTYGISVDYTDEHFYRSDMSVLFNRFDTIDPACKRICVAEYASSVKGNGGNVYGNYGDALGDAVFMIGCEKNSERMWWTGYGNYSGFAGHGNFGPCIVWNDAVSSFVTPSYYMQKILFSDNQGTRILPYLQNNTNCYWSATIDTESGKDDILLKVVNKSPTSESVSINLKGSPKVNPIGHFTMLTGVPDAENTLSNPDNIVPSSGTFAAGTGFNYVFKAWSATVLRIGISK